LKTRALNMSPSLEKKAKKSVLKSKLETPSKISTPSANSSSSLSKPLKRKKEIETTAITANDEDRPAKVAKKSKKDDISKLDEPVIADTKKSKIAPSTAQPPNTTTAESVENSPKLKSRAKKASTSLPACGAPKSILKKSQPTKPIPTSISRPRKTTEASKQTKSKNPQVVVPEPEKDEEIDGSDEADDGNEEDSDSEGHLHGFSTDDDDSSDEEDAMNDEPSDVNLGKLPTIAKDDATVRRKLEKAKLHPVRIFFVFFCFFIIKKTLCGWSTDLFSSSD